MPDGNNQRTSGRKPAGAGRHETDPALIDPLAELARIVSEGAPEPAPRRQRADEAVAAQEESTPHPGEPPAPHREPPPAQAGPLPLVSKSASRNGPLGPDLIDDLEAELLSNLQASFSEVEAKSGSGADAVQPAPAAPEPEPSPPAPEPRLQTPRPITPEPPRQVDPPPAAAPPRPPSPAERPAARPASPAEGQLDAPAILRQRLRGAATPPAAAAAPERQQARPPARPADADPFAPTMESAPTTGYPHPGTEVAARPIEQTPESEADGATPDQPRWPPRMDDLTDEWLNDISGLRAADADVPPESALPSELVEPPLREPEDPRGPVRGAPASAEPIRADDQPAGLSEGEPAPVRRRVDIAALALRRGRRAESEAESGAAPPLDAPTGAPRAVPVARAEPVARSEAPAQTELPEAARRGRRAPAEAERVEPDQQTSRWEAPAVESRFAPRTRAIGPRDGAPRVELPQQPAATAPGLVSEGAMAADSVEHDEPPPLPGKARRGGAGDEFADEAFPLDDEFLPFETDDLKGLIGPRRPPLGLIAGGVLLAVVAFGGGAALFIMNAGAGGNGPIVVAADSGPIKVAPSAIDPGEDEPNKLIYDRVDGAPEDQQVAILQPGAETPVDRTADPSDNAIARVILPDPINGGGPPAEGVSVAPQPPPPQDLGPRRVRTVVVRPDGTIVSNSTDGPADAAGEALSLQPEPLPPNDTLAIAGAGANGAGEIAITPNPPAVSPPPLPPPAAAPQEAPTLALAPEPRPTPPPPQPPPQQQAALQPETPIDITPAPTAPAPAASALPTSGMLVQISSQRSEEAALTTFQDLQSRYPRILGPFNVDIQRADLGARGIYYRVRVGPFSPSDAQRLCDDLKAAGGDCILSRS